MAKSETGRIRAGVVGLGYFGSFHARHYAASPLAALVAVADHNPGKAEATAAAHGGVGVVDHRDLIGLVDAVSVAVPTSIHHDIACDLIEAGIHVLVEKPVTDDPATARDLVARAARRGVVLQVGHVERFSPTFAALRATVTAPRLIDCVRVAPWTGRAADVDVVLDLMIHDIDLALALAGSPVEQVTASGVAMVGEGIDVAEARLVFRNGVTARLRASRVAPAVERRIDVYEADRVVAADMVAKTVSCSPQGWDPHGATPFGFSPVAVPDQDALGAEIAAFLATVAGGRAEAVDGAAGLAALETAERIRSALRGGAAAESGAKRQRIAGG